MLTMIMIYIYCYCPVNYYILVRACNTESRILEKPKKLQGPSRGCDDDVVSRKEKKVFEENDSL
jgi:hypothetical protein